MCSSSENKNILGKTPILNCVALYEVLNIFSKTIFDLFKINIQEVPTIASLALKIYRSNFMDEPEKSKIGITDYNSYQKLIDGYSGGAVDVYKPRSPIGENVYCYDFNSLYPTIMKNCDNK